MESVDSLIHAAFRSEQILAEFAPIPALMNEVSPHFRLAMVLEMLEHPPFPLMRQQIANLNIVCSIQKVGSTTICETLSRHPSIHCRSNLRHVHFLSQNNLAFLNEQLSRCRNHPNSHEWVQHMAHCHWVRTLLAANKAIRRGGMASSVDKPVVITGVREPIAQYLSMVFQNWWMYVDSPAALTTEFLQARMPEDPWVGRCAEWFTSDLGEMFGVDVYARPFPTERGWDIYENDNARILLIRQENLNRLPEALGSLYRFDPSTVQMTTANEGDSKNYAAQYAKVKRSFHLDDRELESLYSLPHARHFYSAEQIEQFKKHWRNPSGERSTHRSLHLSVPNPSLFPLDRPFDSSIPESPRTASRVLTKCRAVIRRIFQRGQAA